MPQGASRAARSWRAHEETRIAMARRAAAGVPSACAPQPLRVFTTPPCAIANGRAHVPSGCCGAGARTCWSVRTKLLYAARADSLMGDPSRRHTRGVGERPAPTCSARTVYVGIFPIKRPHPRAVRHARTARCAFRCALAHVLEMRPELRFGDGRPDWRSRAERPPRFFVASLLTPSPSAFRALLERRAMWPMLIVDRVPLASGSPGVLPGAAPFGCNPVFSSHLVACGPLAALALAAAPPCWSDFCTCAQSAGARGVLTACSFAPPSCRRDQTRGVCRFISAWTLLRVQFPAEKRPLDALIDMHFALHTAVFSGIARYHGGGLRPTAGSGATPGALGLKVA